MSLEEKQQDVSTLEKVETSEISSKGSDHGPQEENKVLHSFERRSTTLLIDV